ncbi:MAG: peptide chain release factor 3, partial [Clostridia bacterium]|nr:peptide chain release factor 3 [Clostridia bacterium]
YRSGNHGQFISEKKTVSMRELWDSGLLEKHYLSKLRDEIDLLDGAGDAFAYDKVLAGELTPVFFGSAITNFGVEPFLERFLKLTPPPLPRKGREDFIMPEEPFFSGFIFKIQANMNPAHRDRLAFLRVVSGSYEKGMTVWHSGTDKEITLKQPQHFMADEREILEEAWPGDIIGLFDPGIFHLGDTLSAGRKVQYEDIPVFAPERFCRVRAENSLKRKQFLKGITQLSQEGAIRVFKRTETGREEMIIGVVGQLQFDVLEYRLKNEYQADLVMESLPYRFVRWVTSLPAPPEKLRLTSTSARAADDKENPVLMFENEWSIRLALENNDGLQLSETRGGITA